MKFLLPDNKKEHLTDQLPERFREPAAPDVQRNASVIPDNWANTRTPSGSDTTESEEDNDRARYDIPNGTKGNNHSTDIQSYY